MKKDKKLIPKNTYYCYSAILGKNEELCPYWSKIGNIAEQESGYCSYLGKGDYELNREERFLEVLFKKKGKWATKKVKVDKDHPTFMSLIWDQIKECNIGLPELEKHLEKIW